MHPVLGGNEPHLSFCSQCHLVGYCNRQCQKSDWPRHKRQCKLMRACNAILSEEVLSDAEPEIRDRPLANAYTVALAVKQLWPEIQEAGSGALFDDLWGLRVLLLGCRNHVEGEIDFVLLGNLIRRYTPWSGEWLRVDLVGPELEDDSKVLTLSPSLHLAL
jgi:hypothetical protein